MYRKNSTSKIIAVTQQPHRYSKPIEVAHEISGFGRCRYSSALVYKGTALKFHDSCQKNRLCKHKDHLFFHHV